MFLQSCLLPSLKRHVDKGKVFVTRSRFLPSSKKVQQRAHASQLHFSPKEKTWNGSLYKTFLADVDRDGEQLAWIYYDFVPEKCGCFLW